MKAYLEGANLFRQQRSKSKVNRQAVKNRQPSPSFGGGKVRLAVEGIGQCGTDRRKKNHQRAKTDVLQRKSYKCDSTQPLNKTQSKTRLKTEISSYNSRTVKVIHQQKTQKKVDLDVNPLWGIVKERLANDSKTKRQMNSSHPVVKKLLELTQQAKKKEQPSKTKNPQEVPVRKQLHRSMEIHVNSLRHEIAKDGKNGRQLGMCEVLRQMVNYAERLSYSTQHRQSRLLNKVKELEDRNVRLITLMNKLKRQGVDVDSFWCSYSGI